MNKKILFNYSIIINHFHLLLFFIIFNFYKMLTSIGPHLHKGKFKTYNGALSADLEVFKNTGLICGACQLFIMGPQSMNMNFTEEDALSFGKYAAEQNIKIIVHNSYMVSLWNNNKSRRPISRIKIKEQLAICDIMGALGFVIHLPDEDVSEITDELLHVIEGSNGKFKTRIYLENKAQRPSLNSYEKILRLNLLFSAIAINEKLNNIGLCIDTAHLWSSGLSLTTKADAVKWFGELSKIANGYLWNKDMIIFHLNDAVYDFGNGKDEHAELTHGQIWSNDKTGLIEIIEFIYKCGVIAILERNKTSAVDDCKLIYNIIKELKK